MTDKVIVLQGTVGSTAYGLNHAGSDVDTLGTFVYMPEEYMKLRHPEESIVSNDPDVTLHELRKFCLLAFKCNPTVTELLWLNEYTSIANGGSELIYFRQDFLSERCVREAYLGYAGSQLKRLEDRDWHRAAKHAKHMARLTRQGHELYTTGNLTIRVQDPEWYQWFSEQDSHYWVEWFSKEEEQFRASKSVLPEKPTFHDIEYIYYRARKDAGS
jgi:uncharacterized protein